MPRVCRRRRSITGFGTDEVGRDLFSRVLIGSQQSVAAGLAVVLIAGISGSLLGCLSGVLGGRSDALIMRLMDIMLSIPSLVLTMALAAALGPSLFNAMLAIAIVRIPFYVRLARGQNAGGSSAYFRRGLGDVWRLALASDQLAYSA